MFFPLIDCLRGFAALSVVVYHIIVLFNWISFPASGPLVWFRIGWMGVDLFFVISGFVISLSAFSTLDKTFLLSRFYGHFARHRAARIIPLHYLTCLVFIIFVQPFMLFDHHAWRQWLTHALFIHNWFPDHQGGINGVNWSLAAEMQFYILIMLSAPWIRRCRWPIIAIFGFGIAWSWRAATFTLTDINGPTGVFHRFVYETQLPGMLDEFALGILLARFIRSDYGRRFVTGNIHRLWITPFVSAVLMFVSEKIFWNNAFFWNSMAMVVFFRTLIGLS
ncbi:acyltransferase [Acetobacter orientalis]|nr:acyltransferase [Acetobacter orientalis]MCP1215484.1 acyltransferase [Acetobacter orientalis]